MQTNLITHRALALAEFTNQLLEYGMYDAVNLDGGGSSRLKLGSIVENVGEMGAPVPGFLRRAIAAFQDAAQQAGDKWDKNSKLPESQN